MVTEAIMNPQELTNELKFIYADELESVILYGSAANGEFHKGHSDYNVIIVLKKPAPAEIIKSCGIIKKWVKNGNPLPLMFSPNTIKNAADVFPIEFSDIKSRHKILFGTDPFQNITIDLKNLRHQCEHELRSKILNLKSRLALLGNSPKELIKLILESSSSFFAIFSGILKLANIKPASSKKALVEQLATVTDMDPAIFIEIVDVREGNRIWRKEEALEKFEQYLTSVCAVVRYVAKL